MLVSKHTLTRVPSLRRVLLTGAVAAAVWATTASPAHAAIRNWDGGGGDTLWSNSANWENDIPPGFAVGDIAGFRQESPNPVTIFLGGNRAVNEVRFFSTTNQILNNTTFGLLILQSDSSFGTIIVAGPPGSTATHTINSRIRIQTNNRWFVQQGETLVVNGNITHEDNVINSLTKEGGGTLKLRGNNGFSSPANRFFGDIIVKEGTLEAGFANSLGPQNHVEVDAGATLRMVAGEAFGSLGGFGNVVLNAAITIGQNNRDATFQGTLSGAGAFSTIGSGEFRLSGTTNNTNTGLTTVRDGTMILFKLLSRDAMAGNLQIGDGAGAAKSAIVEQFTNNNLPDDTVVTLSSDGWWDMTPPDSVIRRSSETISELKGTGVVDLHVLKVGSGNASSTYNGILEGNNLTKIGTGTLTLTGNNTHTGGTRIEDGVLEISTAANLGANSSTITFAGGALRVDSPTATNVEMEARTFVADGSDVVFDITTIGNTRIQGQISGNGGLVKNGMGNLIVRNTPATYSGPTTINQGSITLNGSDELLPDNTDVTINSGAELRVFGGRTETIDTLSGVGSVAFVLNNTNNHLILGADNGIGTFSGAISGTGRLTKIGSGTQTLSGSSPNSYTGLTTINSGTLQLSKSNNVNAVAGDVQVGDGTGGLAVLNQTTNENIPDASSVTVLSDGTWNVSTETVNAINGSGVITLGDLTVGAGNGTGMFSGNFQGAGTLTKTGAGTLTLSGNNNGFTGDVVVNGGILEVGLNDGLIQPAAFTVAGAGTLRVVGFEGFGSLAGGGNTELNANLQVGFNGDTTVYSGQVSGAGNLQKFGAGTMTLTGNNTYTGGTVVAGGTLVVDADSLPASSGVTNNATLEFNQGNNGTYDGRIFGTGKLVKSGLGVLTLAGTTAYTGGTDITSGTLKVGPFRSSVPDRGTVTISTGATLDLDGNFEITGGLAGSGSVALGAGGHLLVRLDNASTTFSGAISDDGKLTKIGTGTQTLTGNNTYGDGTTVAEGTLVVDTDSLPAANGVANNATLEFNQTFDGTYAGVISGSGQVVKSGAAKLTLDQANTHTGGTTVSGGTLVVNTNSLPAANGVVNNATLEFNQTFDGTYAGAMSGTGQVVKSGAAKLTLDQANTYTGGTTIDGGTLSLGNSSAAGSGSITVLGSTIDYANGVNIANAIDLQNDATLNVNTGSATQSGAIGETGGSFDITKTGAGVLSLDAVNTHTGGTRIEDGVLEISTAANLGANASTITFAGGTLRVDSPTAANVEMGARTFVADGSDVVFDITTIGNTRIQGQISGNGGLVKNGMGNLIVRNTPATYSGPTTINQGSITLNGSDELLPDNTDVTINSGAALRLFGGRTETIDTLNGVGSVAFILNNNTNNHLILGADNGIGTFSGAISGDGRLTKIGTGTQTLTGNSTYTGTTTIDGGTLLANNTTGSATGTGGVTINSGGTLGGTGSAAGTTTVNAGGTLAPGASVGALALGGVAFESNSTFAVELAAGGGVPGTDYDQVVVTANVSLDGALDIVLLNGFTPAYLDEFEILTAATRSGEFDQINGAFINGDMTLAPVYDFDGSVGLTLVAAIPGDANLDGIVNGQDLLALQANLFSGDQWVQGDFNLDGLVGGQDLLILQSHLFNTVQGLGTTAFAAETLAVPEPGTLGLMVLSVLGTAARRRTA